jgi:ubiquinone/menaquinone biosynthesis C-methylase UbiE
MQYLFQPFNRFLKPSQRLWYLIYRQLDAAFRPFDDRRLLMVDHLKLIPPARYRTPGQSALSEFGYSAGVMAAYLGEHLKSENPHILDLGCGTGKMVSAVWGLLGERGRYTGLDIDSWMIDFDRRWYPSNRCSFIHAPVYNAMYNPKGIPQSEYRLPLEDGSIDAAIAFSLFTHLRQEDAQHYFQELARLLKPGAPALFTFFLIDERYDPNRFRGTRWCFDSTIEGQPEWYYASYYKAIPEAQIGVTRKGIDLLLGDDFTLEKVYSGWWCGLPGAMLQDALVFRRKGEG